MAGDAGTASAARVRSGLRVLLRGREDTRVRATIRVTLAWPVLWFALGTLAVTIAMLVVPAAASLPTRTAVTGLLQGAVVAVGLVLWARLLDRRRVSEYGLHLRRDWLLDAAVGFGAVLVGFAAWLSIGAALGWLTVDAAASRPGLPPVAGLAALVVAYLVNAWVQETVFVGVTVTNAAEGLASRDVAPSRAVLGAWVVAVILFAAKHRPSELARARNLLLALGIYGLLYAQSGELALPVGVHGGVNVAGGVVAVSPSIAAERPAVLAVSKSIPWPALESLSDGAIPPLLVAYLLALGWLAWRRDGLGLDRRLAEWAGRDERPAD